MHERYYVELAKQEKLLSRKNEKSDFYMLICSTSRS